MIGIITVIMVGFVLFAVLVQKTKGKVKKTYQDSLQKLKHDPNNPDLRETTLRLGRRYAEILRDSRGYTPFDETALLNDINAARARATLGQNSLLKVEVTNPMVMSSQSVAQEIEKLGKLLIAGVITGEEFERGKALFLGAPPDKAASAVDLLQNLDALKRKGVLSESEFNIKKWEILSERLIPGRMQAAKLQQQPSLPPPVPPSLQEQIQFQCPSCEKQMTLLSAASGSRHSCPHCKQTIEIE